MSPFYFWVRLVSLFLLSLSYRFYIVIFKIYHLFLPVICTLSWPSLQISTTEIISLKGVNFLPWVILWNQLEFNSRNVWVDLIFHRYLSFFNVTYYKATPFLNDVPYATFDLKFCLSYIDLGALKCAARSNSLFLHMLHFHCYHFEKIIYTW